MFDYRVKLSCYEKKKKQKKIQVTMINRYEWIERIIERDIIPENRIDSTREKGACSGETIVNNVHFRSKQRLEVTDAW